MGVNRTPRVPPSSLIGPLPADVTGNKRDKLRILPCMAPEQRVSPSCTRMPCRCTAIWMCLKEACLPGMSHQPGQRVYQAVLLLLAGKLH